MILLNVPISSEFPEELLVEFSQPGHSLCTRSLQVILYEKYAFLHKAYPEKPLWIKEIVIWLERGCAPISTLPD